MSIFYQKGARFYDRIWSGFTQKTLQQVLKALDLKRLGEQKTSVRLLDIACGTGELELRLVPLKPELEIIGLDYSLQMLVQAQRKVGPSSQVAFVQGDANYSLPFVESSFDIVTFANALHYLSCPDKLLLEVKRVLKPGGQLVIEDFTVHGRLFWPLFEKLIHWLDPQYQKTYTLVQLNQLAAQAGFVIQESSNFKIDLIWGGMFISAAKKPGGDLTA